MSLYGREEHSLFSGNGASDNQNHVLCASDALWIQLLKPWRGSEALDILGKEDLLGGSLFGRPLMWYVPLVSSPLLSAVQIRGLLFRDNW